MNKPHYYKTFIALPHTDAAGIAYFGSILDIIQEAFEDMFRTYKQGIGTYFNLSTYITPVVNVVIDYKASLFMGDEVTVKVEKDHVGKTSFSFKYTVSNQKDVIIANARIVYVCVEATTRQATPLPKEAFFLSNK